MAGGSNESLGSMTRNHLNHFQPSFVFYQQLNMNVMFPVASPLSPAPGANRSADTANFDTLWKYVCPMMKQIDDLTRETQNLRLKVSKLEQNIDSLNKAYSHTRANHSPKDPVSAIEGYGALKKQRSSVHQSLLPDDVLRIVFVNCLPKKGEAAMKAREAPLSLSRVCSTWRRVAWATQELWNTFEIEIPTLIVHPFHQLRSMCNAYVGWIGDWIKRSGKLPLYISLTDRNPLDWEFGDGRKELLKRVIEEISPYSTRWKSIRFELPAFIIKSHLHVNSLDPSTLEILGVRNLSLEWASYRPGPLSMTQQNDIMGCHPIMMNNSRRLRSLHLTDPTMARPGNALQAQPSFTILQWDSLEDLSICTEHSAFANISLNVSDAHSILQHLAASAPQLRSCRMALRSSGLTSGNQICLPSLQEFAITLLVGEQPSSFHSLIPAPTDYRLSPLFSCLKCPSLCSFMYRADMETVLPFDSLLKETQALKKLHVDSVRVRRNTQTFQRWEECLRFCPHITELHASTALSTFSYGTISSILPSLEVLVLDCTPPLDRTEVFQPFLDKQTTSEPLLRRNMERDRRLKLRQRVGLVLALCHSKKDLHGDLQLKEVRFRLSERLRDEALHSLAPVIAMGLRVTFKDDYCDIPPPVGSPLLRGITKFYEPIVG